MSGKGKKHKRGERGSIEEIIVAKKQNMDAASPDPKVQGNSTHNEEGYNPNEENEISLKEVMQLLQNVQQTLQEMRVENKNLTNELRELKANRSTNSQP